MQTLWHRKGDEQWLRLTRFFGTLLLINFAIGVATGLVQEFQFGMNWSVYSRVRRRRLRRAARDRGARGLLRSRRPSSACGSSAGTGCRRACTWRRSGSWRSAPGCRRTSSSSRTPGCSTPSATRSSGGRRRADDVWALLTNNFALRAFLHTMLAGLIDGVHRRLRRRLLAHPPRGATSSCSAKPRCWR